MQLLLVATLRFHKLCLRESILLQRREAHPLSRQRKRNLMSIFKNNGFATILHSGMHHSSVPIFVNKVLRPLQVTPSHNRWSFSTCTITVAPLGKAIEFLQESAGCIRRNKVYNGISHQGTGVKVTGGVEKVIGAFKTVSIEHLQKILVRESLWQLLPHHSRLASIFRRRIRYRLCGERQVNLMVVQSSTTSG